MIKFGTRKQGNGKRSRGHNKFSRGTKVMKNFEGSKLSMRIGKWTEISIRAEHLFRFLHSNIRRPVDKVFSEFVARCDKSIYNPKETFYSWIEKKEEIDPRWGGFYVTNGILNYKKRKRESIIKRSPVSMILACSSTGKTFQTIIPSSLLVISQYEMDLHFLANSTSLPTTEKE